MVARAWFEITYSLIKLCEMGMAPGELARKSHTETRVMGNYLKDLMRIGWLEKIEMDGSEKYRTLQPGLQAIQYFQRYLDTIPDENLKDNVTSVTMQIYRPMRARLWMR